MLYVASFLSDQLLRSVNRAAPEPSPTYRRLHDVPRHGTADLDIVCGRGTVTALDDPKSWHVCAVRSLEPVRFPVSETAGHVQIRLTLR